MINSCYYFYSHSHSHFVEYKVTILMVKMYTRYDKRNEQNAFFTYPRIPF